MAGMQKRSDDSGFTVIHSWRSPWSPRQSEVIVVGVVNFLSMMMWASNGAVRWSAYG